MKRLSVRLSAIGAVLVLGSAAIAYSVLSNSKEGDSVKESPKIAKKKQTDGEPPSPIRAERENAPGESPAGKVMQPPPGMFGDGAVRKANHETPAAGDELADQSNGIPPDPSGTDGGFRIPESSAYGGGLPDAVPDNPTGDFATPADPTSATSDDSAFPAPPGPLASEAMNPTENELTSDSEAPLQTLPSSGGIPPAPGADSPATIPESGTSEFAGGSIDDGSPTPAAPGYGGLGAPVDSTDSIVGRELPSSETGPIDTAASTYSTDPSPPTGNVIGGVVGAGAGLAAGAAIGNNPRTMTDNPAANVGTSADGGVADTYPPAQPGGTTPGTTYPAADSPTPSGYGEGGYGTAGNSYEPSPAAGALPGSSPTGTGFPTGPSAGTYATGQGTSTLEQGGPVAVSASNVPGDRQLEGQQAPSILIEKTAPEEVQVNRKATFQIRVRNNGNAPAHNVVVVDRVPNGTQFIDATPPVMPTADGTLVWRVDSIRPGDEVVLAMNLLPKQAGEIGSVAQATFQTVASVRTICTKPELKLDVSIDEQVLIGQPARLEITITNVGNGAAERVVIDEDVPEGFTHAAGRELEQLIGTLQPQESKRLTLVLESVKPGTYQNHMTVRGEGNLFDEDVRVVQVTSPQLQVAMQGPKLRYLDRQATYAVTLANPGTAVARNVQLVTFLPKGMKYVTSDNHGQYDTQSHAVYWSLEELPVSKQGDVHVTVLPIEPGAHKLKSDVKAELGLQQSCEHEVTVQGLAELSFAISDVADPIEVGSETTYEVKVVNRGSKPDTEIQLVAELPPGLTPTSGDGPTQGTVQGQMVVFGPLPQLGPNEEAIFKVHARGAANGDHVMRAQLRSGELRVPVTKEEITRVYADN